MDRAGGSGRQGFRGMGVALWRCPPISTCPPPKSKHEGCSRRGRKVVEHVLERILKALKDAP
jgi:hypothetical protein